MCGGAHKRLEENRLVVLAQKLEIARVKQRRQPIVDRVFLDAVTAERVEQSARGARLEAILPTQCFERRLAHRETHDLAQL